MPAQRQELHRSGSLGNRRTGLRAARFTILKFCRAYARWGRFWARRLYVAGQCRAPLDPRSDIYSSVSSLPDLSGATPFSGDFHDVMERKDVDPPPLKAKTSVARYDRDPTRRLTRIRQRPQTADPLPRDGVSRRGHFWSPATGMVIYNEHLLNVLGLPAFFALPMIVLTCFADISYLK